MADEAEERNLPPSQRKLQKAREKGQVMASADFVAGVMTFAGVILVASSISIYAGVASDAFRMGIDSMSRAEPLRSGAIVAVVIKSSLDAVIPLVLVVGLVGLAANIAHKRGLVVSVEPVKPDLKRISPTDGFKKVFSARNAIEFSSSMLRAAIWFALAAILIIAALPTILGTATCGLSCVVEVGRSEIWKLMIIGLILLLIAAFIDLPLQNFLFLKDMKMSRQELKREFRETEGSPEFESMRRGEYREMAMGSGSPKLATFVVVSANVAVALRYDAKDTPVPVVLAAGRGANADRIIAAAEKVRTPVMDDPDVANMLIARTKVGEIVPKDQFNAIALLLLKSQLARRSTNLLK
jgi:type III secretion protein U